MKSRVKKKTTISSPIHYIQMHSESFTASAKVHCNRSDSNTSETDSPDWWQQFAETVFKLALSACYVIWYFETCWYAKGFRPKLRNILYSVSETGLVAIFIISMWVVRQRFVIFRAQTNNAAALLCSLLRGGRIALRLSVYPYVRRSESSIKYRAFNSSI